MTSCIPLHYYHFLPTKVDSDHIYSVLASVLTGHSKEYLCDFIFTMFLLKLLLVTSRILGAEFK